MFKISNELKKRGWKIENKKDQTGYWLRIKNQDNVVFSFFTEEKIDQAIDLTMVFFLNANLVQFRDLVKSMFSDNFKFSAELSSKTSPDYCFIEMPKKSMQEFPDQQEDEIIKKNDSDFVLYVISDPSTNEDVIAEILVLKENRLAFWGNFDFYLKNKDKLLDFLVAHSRLNVKKSDLVEIFEIIIKTLKK